LLGKNILHTGKTNKPNSNSKLALKVDLPFYLKAKRAILPYFAKIYVAKVKNPKKVHFQYTHVEKMRMKRDF